MYWYFVCLRWFICIKNPHQRESWRAKGDESNNFTFMWYLTNNQVICKVYVFFRACMIFTWVKTLYWVILLPQHWSVTHALVSFKCPKSFLTKPVPLTRITLDQPSQHLNRPPQKRSFSKVWSKRFLWISALSFLLC